MMRFKKGSRVEVLRKEEVPSESWYCAEIIHGNGHYYTVRYEGDFGGPTGARFERVPRKSIRPCPPPTQILEDWTSGDTVEVYHQFSWKVATVLSALSSYSLLVRLFEPSIEVEVGKIDVRARVCWQDNGWKVIGKVSNISEEMQGVPSTSKHNQTCKQRGSKGSIRFKDSDHFNNIHDRQQPVPPTRSLKRKASNLRSELEERSVIKKVKKKSRRCSRHTTLPAMVPAAAADSTQKGLLEKSMPTTLKGKLLGCSEAAALRRKTKKGGGGGGSFGIGLEPFRDNWSITSSVASCSASKNNASQIFQRYRGQDNDEYNSDAESVCQLGSSEEGNSLLLPADEKLAEEIHRLELHAYHTTMEALYVAGPLSWEQEYLLSNLRESLHISNDEHLTELRNLTSRRDTCSPNC